MPVVDITKDIQAPPDVVWEFITDIGKAPEWVTVMEELIETTDNPVKLNTVYRERSRIGPRESETEWKITLFEDRSIQVHECNEPDFKAKLTMAIKPEGFATQLTHRTEYRLMPNFRPLGWLLEQLFIRRTMEKNLNATVNNAKRMIEGSQS